MLVDVEIARQEVAARTQPARKSELGQFFTPAATANFMASLFGGRSGGDCRLLDAGAGIGSLSAAFAARASSGGDLRFDRLKIAAFEVDLAVADDLRRILAGCLPRSADGFSVRVEDFIEAAVNQIQFSRDRFTHAILNPPYGKISSDSAHRRVLRSAGIETVNLYSAFVALALELLEPGGELVAIIPRSFCNGPYFRPFREFVLERAAIRRIHLFDSRDSAFKDDGVLQENVIVHLQRDGAQGPVAISRSTDDLFHDLTLREMPFERVVERDDAERVIFVTTEEKRSPLEVALTFGVGPASLGVTVSTGPVVDFRLREYLFADPASGSAPLLYPHHFSGGTTVWPQVGHKRPNAIAVRDETLKWLYHNGFFVVVRRLSSKEERRRVVAHVVSPNDFAGHDWLGFENHLNVFHVNRGGLDEPLARGIAAYLNSSLVDDLFRRFNGHTQVNASDLKRLPFPPRAQLDRLGRLAMAVGTLAEVDVDRFIQGIVE